MRVNIICKNCKKEFKDYLSSRRVFCSHSCYSRDRSKKMIGRPNVYAISGFKRSPDEFPPERLKKMSKQTKARYAKGEKFGFQKGDKHWAWRGGITTKDYRLRRSRKSVNWRKQVFERDDYTCQDCGKRGGELQADHIKRWRDYPELRFELSNGRTLCKDCHLKTPTWGQRRGNLYL